MKKPRAIAIRETMLLVGLIGLWLAITIQWGAFSLLFWGLTVAMAGVLRPAHQRRPVPDSVTDVMSITVSWAVACGVLGLILDLRTPNPFAPGVLGWAMIGEITGFYLGFIWVLVLRLYRHIERVTSPVNHARRAI